MDVAQRVTSVQIMSPDPIKRICSPQWFLIDPKERAVTLGNRGSLKNGRFTCFISLQNIFREVFLKKKNPSMLVGSINDLTLTSGLVPPPPLPDRCRGPGCTAFINRRVDRPA